MISPYESLAEFHLLRDTNSEIRGRAWARPAARAAMDQYFRIQRAKEELKRVKIEIRRVVTWIRDENRLLRKKVLEENRLARPKTILTLGKNTERKNLV